VTQTIVCMLSSATYHRGRVLELGTTWRRSGCGRHSLPNGGASTTMPPASTAASPRSSAGRQITRTCCVSRAPAALFEPPLAPALMMMISSRKVPMALRCCYAVYVLQNSLNPAKASGDGGERKANTQRSSSRPAHDDEGRAGGGRGSHGSCKDAALDLSHSPAAADRTSPSPSPPAGGGAAAARRRTRLSNGITPSCAADEELQMALALSLSSAPAQHWT
jgi:hypothetical protein